MQVVSDCPNCGRSFGWTMNQVEGTPDGGRRPARSPNCPNCGFDVTESNERAPRNFHYYAKTDDAEGMQELMQTLTQAREGAIQRRAQVIAERERLTQEAARRTQEWGEARKKAGRRISNLFGLLSPRPPEPPVLPEPNVPAGPPDVNAAVQGQGFNPLIVAAIYGSERAVEFLLNNGADRAQIPLALKKAEEFRHPGVIRLLAGQSGNPPKVAPVASAPPGRLEQEQEAARIQNLLKLIQEEGEDAPYLVETIAKYGKVAEPACPFLRELCLRHGPDSDLGRASRAALQTIESAVSET